MAKANKLRSKRGNNIAITFNFIDLRRNNYAFRNFANNKPVRHLLAFNVCAKLPAARDFFASDDDWDNGRILAARRRGLGQVILKELSEMNGVTFSFTSGSPSYCGISFMGLLIVDEENGLIYEISLKYSGPC
jgi:hypothetical protein